MSFVFLFVLFFFSATWQNTLSHSIFFFSTMKMKTTLLFNNVYYKEFLLFSQGSVFIFKHTNGKNWDIRVLSRIACTSFMPFIVPPSDAGFEKVLFFFQKCLRYIQKGTLIILRCIILNIAFMGALLSIIIIKKWSVSLLHFLVRHVELMYLERS